MMFSIVSVNKKIKREKGKGKNMCRHMLFKLGLFYIVSISVFAADYPPNIDYGSQGDFLAKRGGDRGRTALLNLSGPILINTPEAPGSSSAGITADFTDTAWDLSDLTNPQLISEYNCFGETCYRAMGIHAHAKLTRYHEGEAYFGAGRWWQIGTGGWLRYNPDEESSVEQMLFSNDPWNETGWRYSDLTSPYHTIDYWQYNFTPSSLYQIKSSGSSNAEVFAEWDHIGLTGAAGFPIFLGNLLVFVSDQQQTGIAIYDISGMKEGNLPRLISRYNPDVTLPNGDTERVGGYWVEPYGTNKIVWAARRRGSPPARQYPAFFVIDITDPINPQLSCEIYFDQDTSVREDGKDSNPMYVNFQDQYAYVDNFKVDIPGCESAYADDAVIDNEEFFKVVSVLDLQNNFCNGSQYFRPLGQVGVFGGGDSWSSTHLIEYTTSDDSMREGAYFGLFRDGEKVTQVRIGHHFDDGSSTIYSGGDVQVGDAIMTGAGASYTVTKVTVDERINEQGMCFVVTSDEADTIAPYVSGHMPRANQANVPVDSFIHFHIPETLRDHTLANAVTVTNIDTTQTISFKMQSSHTGTVSIWPDEDLLLGGEYRVDIAGVQDFMGNTMEPYSFRFTTGVSPYQAIDITPEVPAPKFEGTPYYPNHSGQIACEAGEDYDSVWVVNPDNDSVSLAYAYADPGTFEVNVEVENDAFVYTDSKPTSVTRVGEYVAVTYGDTDKLRFNRVGWWGTSPSTSWLKGFGYGTQPVASVAHGDMLYVALYGSGEIAKVDIVSKQIISRLKVGPKPKAMALTSDGSRLLVTRFISDKDYAEVYDINTVGNMSFRDASQPSIRINKVLVPDDIAHGSGVPNYLRSIVIGPNDEVAYVTANKANIDRGLFLNGAPLDDDNTIRPMIAMIDLVNHWDINVDPTSQEGTMDLDNSADPSGITILPDGVTRVHALQGNNVMTFDNLATQSTFRASTGFAPQSLCATERNLYVKNFTDRTVTVLDIANYMYYGTNPEYRQTLVTVLPEEDVKTAEELRGLQVFYHARAPDISPEGYISCASCHDDGGHDGMTWDLTHMGEGLRNTLSLRGTSGTRFGHLHWSSNFDEVQDFEAQIESLNGADGLISGQTFTNMVSPLTHISAGQSEDLDALSAYVSSLGKASVLRSPNSCSWGGLCGSEERYGNRLFLRHRCATCHTGAAFRDGQSHDVGTITPASGQGSGGPLMEIRTPTLVELWDTAPYLHDGSAATLEEVFTRGVHAEIGLDEGERSNLAQYLLNLDRLDFIEDDEVFIGGGNDDTDGDGVGDNADAFPNDPDETTDTDGDGSGDNADAFPNDATETADTDGDGVGDNADAFPNDPARSVAPPTGAEGYRYYRFTPTVLRESDANSIQLAELSFFNGAARQVGATITNPGGSNPSTEMPANANDGDTSTKWLDFNKGALVYDFSQEVVVDSYLLVTANDHFSRDPIRWLLEASNDAQDWTVLNDQRAEDYPTPKERYTATPLID
ncbi:MAG: hypothetical protein ACI9NY_000953 [Kiritimatiellia bacterium]|jgi:hypothetical protein